MVLNDFLQKKYSSETTHLNLNGGCYCFPESYEEYKKNYEHIITNGITVCEKHLRKEIPEILIYDIDLILKTSFISIESKDIILMEFLECVVRQIMNSIKETTESPNLSCHVCIKNSPDGNIYFKKKEDIKVGIHLYFPYIGLFEDTRIYIYNDFIEKIKPVFSNLNIYEYLTIQNPEVIIDKSVIKVNGIIIFGTNKGKHEEGAKYKLVQIIEGIDSQNNFQRVIKNIDEYDDVEMALLYSLHKNVWLSDKIETKVIPDKLIISQTSPVSSVVEPKPKTSSSYVSEKKKVCVRVNKNVPDVYAHYRSILTSLNTERSDIYNDWLKVGICLINSQEDLDFFPLWDEFSRRSSNYNEKSAKDTWNRLNKYNYTLLHTETLYYMLKKDNFKKFEELIGSENSVKEDKNCLSHSLSKIIYEILKEKYVCSCIKNNEWYFFNTFRWIQDDSNNKIFLDIIDIVSEMEFIRIRRNLIEEIIYFSRHYFYDAKFVQKLNSNDDILCFDNGVYDLDKDLFRKFGNCSDYNTLSTLYDFCLPERNKIIEVQRIIEQILPKKDVRDYFMYHLSTCLHGSKKEQIVIILTGSGANGKSVLMNLMSKTLGEYYKQGSITLLTRKRGSSSNASPELIALRDKRMYVLNETEHDDVLYTSILKQLSGGDNIEARDLYKSPITFKPKSKIFFTCNDLPKIPTTDYGTWRRLKVIHFPSKFVDTPDPMKTNEFLKDSYLDSRLDSYVSSFMNILISYYKKYKNNNFVIDEPSEVSSKTKDYQNINDAIEYFIEDMLEYSEEKETPMKIVYEQFKQWFKDNYNTKPITSINFCENMKKRNMYLSERKMIIHFSLKN